MEAFRPHDAVSVVGTDMGMGLPLFATDVMVGPALDDPPTAPGQEIAPPPPLVNPTLETLRPWLDAVVEAFPNTVALEEITQSDGGRPVLAVVLTSRDGPLSAKRRLVVQCRQHGDEPETTQAGALLIYRLLTTLDRSVLTALRSCAVVVIPVANPDGAARLTRINALGQDLNRHWDCPVAAEVIGIKDYLDGLHPDLVVDVHEWVPGDSCQMPMVEPCGGALAERVAGRCTGRVRGRGTPCPSTTGGRRTSRCATDIWGGLPVCRPFCSKRGTCGPETGAGMPRPLRPYTRAFCLP